MKHYSSFSLFQSHIDLAHSYWQRSLTAGDIAIDATCGNGYDTLFLAQTLFKTNVDGQLIGIDRQKEAIVATSNRLQAELPIEALNRISLLNQCHSSFPACLAEQSVSLIVYNLGYLPGGDKSMTTFCHTTTQSLLAALLLIKPGGCISITCYPGHPEGKLEEQSIKEFAVQLSPRHWSCCHHTWLNRNHSPSLLILQKACL